MKLSELGEIVDIPALEDKAWDDFAIDAIFAIQSGKRLENQSKTPGTRPFVGALDHDNGISGFVSNDNDSKDSNVLGVNYNGNGMGLCFYHPYECIFSDDVKRFHLKAMHNNPYVLLFVKVLIEQQRGKFGYLYKFNAKRMASTRIMLPVTDSGEPDYEYMEQYARNMMIRKYRQYIVYLERELNEIERERANGPLITLEDKEWKAFRIGALFAVTRPVARNKDDYAVGDVPFIASGAVNNGMMKGCIPNAGEHLDLGNCVTVSPVDGSTFYQPVDFLGRGGAGSSILILRAKELNRYTGNFIARAIQKTCSKYTYGRMGNKDGIKRDRIMLPVTDSGEPDYDYMEQYGRKMMADKCRQYLDYLRG